MEYRKEKMIKMTAPSDIRKVILEIILRKNLLHLLTYSKEINHLIGTAKNLTIAIIKASLILY